MSLNPEKMETSVERTYKKIPGRIFLFGLAFLFIVFGCKDGELDRSETSRIKIKGQKEILVVRDIGRGWPAPLATCPPGAVGTRAGSGGAADALRCCCAVCPGALHSPGPARDCAE